MAGPNQAFLVTGRQGRQVTDASGVVSRDSSGQKVVMGASVFVLPVVQKLHTMDLSSRRIPVGIRGAVSKQGVKCDLEGVAIVKVGGTESSIRAAAQGSSTSSRASTRSRRRCSPAHCARSSAG